MARWEVLYPTPTLVITVLPPVWGGRGLKLARKVVWDGVVSLDLLVRSSRGFRFSLLLLLLLMRVGIVLFIYSTHSAANTALIGVRLQCKECRQD
ncbi:hypothetical protein E2C01_007235 [Portunus trituberculatus]|uniref:Uncharacterized protein n=1 Tax=Portunus trituberculatus TaxID=210409 RepID=A0A5B7CYW3_PORTR|nr:hypothetical protein [Portunus trituberculatus]